MTAIDVHAPLTLRLLGEPSEADWQRLEDALAQRYERAFRLGAVDRRAALALAGGDSDTARADADGEAILDPERIDGDGYLLPSYDGGGALVRVPLRPGAGSADDTLRLRWTPDPFSEQDFPDRSWWLVSGDSSSLPGLPEIKAAIVGRDGVTAAQLAACSETFVRRAAPHPSYWSFLHPRLGVIARARASSSGIAVTPTGERTHYGVYHFIRDAEGERRFAGRGARGGTAALTPPSAGTPGTPGATATEGPRLSPSEALLLDLYVRSFPLTSGSAHGPAQALDTLAKIRLALELADKTALGEIGEAALRAIRDPTFIVSTLLIIGFYVALWLTPDPTFLTKAFAGALTVYLLYHFTVNDIIGFARAFMALSDACAVATTPDELRVAGNAFLTATGPIGFDILLMIFFWGTTRAIAPRVRAGAVRRSIVRAEAEVAAAQAAPGSGVAAKPLATPSRLLPDARATASDPANATAVLDALARLLPEGARRGLAARRAQLSAGRGGRAADPAAGDARVLAILEAMRTDPLRTLAEWAQTPEEAAAARAQVLATLARAARLRLIELDVVRDPKVRARTAAEGRARRTATQVATDAARDAVARLVAELLSTRPELRDRLANARPEDLASAVGEAVSRAELGAKWSALRLPGGIRLFQNLRLARRIPGFSSIEAWARAHPGQETANLSLRDGQLYRVLGEIDTLVAGRGSSGRLRILELEEVKTGTESPTVARGQVANAVDVLGQIGSGSGDSAGARLFEGGSYRQLGGDVTGSFELTDLNAAQQSTRGLLGRTDFSSQLPFDRATLIEVVRGFIRDGLPARPQTTLPAPAPRSPDRDAGVE